VSQFHKYLKIRRVLLLVNLTVLILVVASLNLLTVYENTLIRQTEAELNSQGFFITSIFKNHYLKQQDKKPSNNPDWRPITPSLDLDQNPLLPIEPPPQKTISNKTSTQSSYQTIGRTLNPILKEAQKYTLSSIQVVDEQGEIFSSTNDEQLGLSMMNRDEVKTALTGRHNSLLRLREVKYPSHIYSKISRSGSYRVHVAMPIIIDKTVLGAVVLSRTPQTLWQMMILNRQTIITYLIGAIILVWLISMATALAINRPIAALIEQAKRALHGEKEAVTPLANPITTEVDTLSRTFSALAHNLEQRSTYILEFASHVSHEFKTPVTAIQGAVELLLDHQDDMSAEQQRKFLQNLQKDSVRLENLVYRLLEYAKADLQQSEKDSCDLSAIIHQMFAEEATVSTTFEAQNGVNVCYASQTIESVLSNLINNAHQAGAAKIELNLSVEKNQIKLTVADNGKGISEANREKIFTPFFTTKRLEGGTGLGLAIITSLLQQQNGDIRYHHRADSPCPTEFILTLPTP
jgi:signal transduction histidine kinase